MSGVKYHKNTAVSGCSGAPLRLLLLRLPHPCCSSWDHSRMVCRSPVSGRGSGMQCIDPFRALMACDWLCGNTKFYFPRFKFQATLKAMAGPDITQHSLALNSVVLAPQLSISQPRICAHFFLLLLTPRALPRFGMSN